MKQLLIVCAASAVVTLFTPVASYAQIAVDTPVGGVRIGEPPRHDERVIRDEDRMHEREVSGRPGCKSVTVKETGPEGERSVTRQKCD